ncbi:MAG: NfeD family protein [Clostridia bacterium]|nr:NfeD family protein [Clostridia bacterium]
MEAWTIWLIIAGFFFILEIATEGFLVFWFGVGAVAALGTSFIPGANTITQVVVFAVVSIILVLSTRKLTEKVKPKDVPTNVYTILGKKALVSQAIDNVKGQGQIKIDGDIWSAKSEDGEPIAEGASVEILSIDGVKTIVKKI